MLALYISFILSVLVLATSLHLLVVYINEYISHKNESFLKVFIAYVFCMMVISLDHLYVFYKVLEKPDKMQLLNINIGTDLLLFGVVLICNIYSMVLIFNKRANHKDIDFYLQLDREVNGKLKDMLVNLSADRSYVFQYHNGGKSISGLSFMKCSNSYKFYMQTLTLSTPAPKFVFIFPATIFCWGHPDFKIFLDAL